MNWSTFGVLRCICRQAENVRGFFLLASHTFNVLKKHVRLDMLSENVH
uniref:Uncharacterized protein n=1 Tax=Arundo donax TaxID=35708 RepID=A0A0A9GWW6_ARUDO